MEEEEGGKEEVEDEKIKVAIVSTRTFNLLETLVRHGQGAHELEHVLLRIQ